MEVNFDYYLVFVVDELVISYTVENLLFRNYVIEYFILLEMCYKGVLFLIKYMMML